ncbi:MAG: hypothetical protein U5O15_10690 [Candidatus Krumholzibacteriota bacterium]|nr:hypothetical protein [Candidatus Krumholzibacteriota bacterium]
MKILAIDGVSNGHDHLRFNATVIEILCSSLALTWFGFCAEKRHVSKVLKTLDMKTNKSFNLYPINSIFRNCSKSKAKLILELLNIYWNALLIIKREKPDRLLFVGVEYTLFPLFASVFLRICVFRQKLDIYVVLHNLYRIKISPTKHILWKIMFNCLDLQCIVLANTVQGKFTELFPKRLSLLWRHPSYGHLIPWAIDKDINLESFRKDNIIRLLLVGRQGTLAISNGFLDLLAALCQKVTEVTGRKFKIIVTSTFQTKEKPTTRTNVKLLNRRLPDQEYFQIIMDSDYVVFPIVSDIDYRASGILADAITMKVPVLAPKAGHFRELCSEDGLNKGGWLYDGRDGLERTLFKIARVVPGEYINMCRYIDYLNEELSLQRAEVRLRSILDI